MSKNDLIAEVLVLDHGYVRFLRMTGTELDIVRAARVSYDADHRTGADEGADEKLIKYLYQNKHTSPFEMVELIFEIKCPLFIRSQWHRHRTWSYNEISARYTELPSDYYIPDPRNVGTQSKSNKQVRDLNPDEYDSVRALEIVQAISESQYRSYTEYKKLLALGAPRELARIVVPMGLYTRFFAKVNLKNLLDFLRLRWHSHAQWEIQQYAEAIAICVKPFFPTVFDCFLKETTKSES